MDTSMSANAADTDSDVVTRWNTAYSSGDFTTARMILAQGLEPYYENAQLLYRLALTEHKLGSISDALQLAIKAVSISKEMAHHLFLSTLLFQNGFLEDARSQALAALELSPDSELIQMRLSEIALRCGDVQGAHHWADTLIANNPGNASGYLYRANIHLQAGEYGYAEAALAEAARLSPNNFVVHNKLVMLTALREHALVELG